MENCLYNLKIFLNTFIRISNYFLSVALSKFSSYSIKPTVLFLGITNKCNMRCDFCFQYDQEESGFDKRSQGFMDQRTFDNLLIQIKGWSTHINLNLFGEPTIHPQLCDWLRKLTINGHFVNLLTNGKKFSDELVKTLVDAEVGQISFSLEELDYNKKRIGGDYYETLESIKKVINYRGYKKKPLISIQSLKSKTLSKDLINKHEAYFKNLGVDNLVWTEMKNWTGDVPTDSNIPSGKIVNSCLYPWTIISVDWDGSITSCCEDFALKNNHGNINDIELRRVWNSTSMKKLRKALQSKDEEKIKCDTGCSNCSVIIEPLGLNSKSSFKQNVIVASKELISNLK